MAQKNSYKKIIRTDKWKLSPSSQQRLYMQLTVKEYRRLCRFLVTVVSTHWVELGGLKSDQVVPALEKLIYATSKNPNPRYQLFERSFRKFPSYLRRAAIMFAVGQVSSYMTRYHEWQSGIRKRRDAKSPILNSDTGCYPSLYKGQCYKLHGFNIVELKVFTGSDWIWISVPIISLRERHKVDANRIKSPSLIVNDKHYHLSVPFECNPAPVKGSGAGTGSRTQAGSSGSGLVVAVDLGINTTATVSVVSREGTVIHREFIHPGRDIDRRDKRLKSVSMRAKKTKRLSRGFCKHTYRKCRNINQQIGHIVSKQIVEIAKSFNAQAIVFENLKDWKPSGGKKRSTLRQRFHNWLKGLIVKLTENKWLELGGKVLNVIAAYTSKLAFDGSGFLKRDNKNF